MNVLVGCEYSGIVGEAFARLGHNVVSCDLEPGERIELRTHVQGDIFHAAKMMRFDLGIFFPPCTYLCKAQIPLFKYDSHRRTLALTAYKFVKELWKLPIPSIAIENPIGLLSDWWMKPTQILQPWNFGSPYEKEFCLWVRGLYPLPVTGKFRRPEHPKKVSNHVNSRHTQSEKSKIRSRFFPEVARAMADTWGAGGLQKQISIF